MKRRRFLRATGAAVSLPVVLNGMKLSTISKTSIFNHINNETDKVLVLIQMNGGNDGLNMVVPLDMYDNLANVRGNILLPQNSILSLTDTLGFHPRMTALKSLYDNAQLSIVQSVGYPNQNRSHFRSKDIWMSGSPADEFWNTGWLGRYFDRDHPGFPEDYPNEDFPDPFAITMGNSVSETCQGIVSNFSMTLNNPFSLGQLSESEADEVPDTPYGEELTFLRTSISQTNAYSETIVQAAEAGNNLVDYPGDNRLAQQLKNIALLISGGLGTKIYIANIGGFDTHANQVAGGDTTIGEHATLLETLSEAIAIFQEDLKQLGVDQRVIGMTFSEFGRRIKSNNSFGTDHGTAAPLMVFGSCINPRVFGDNPEISDQVDNKEGVAMQNDFRDIYGSILIDWFEVPETEVRTLLHSEFSPIPVVQNCAITSTSDPLLQDPIELSNYPNPFRDWTTIAFTSRNEWGKLSVYDTLGSEIRVIFNRQLNEGAHQIQFDASQLASGTYYYRLQLEGRQKTKRMLKIK